MTDLLKLAEAYYTVANDIERQIADLTQMMNHARTSADQLCEMNIREQPNLKPCQITEYDGAYKCATHGKQWGAITSPDEPCAGWVKP